MKNNISMLFGQLRQKRARPPCKCLLKWAWSVQSQWQNEVLITGPPIRNVLGSCLVGCARLHWGNTETLLCPNYLNWSVFRDPSQPHAVPNCKPIKIESSFQYKIYCLYWNQLVSLYGPWGKSEKSCLSGHTQDSFKQKPVKQGILFKSVEIGSKILCIAFFFGGNSKDSSSRPGYNPRAKVPHLTVSRLFQVDAFAACSRIECNYVMSYSAPMTAGVMPAPSPLILCQQ